jgi:methylenetetrahydrofolate reductase (NADPH)
VETETANSLFAPIKRANPNFSSENTMFSTSRIPVSLEFFPPKTPEGAEKLRLVRQQLYPLQPSFCSVTFGAGGSTQEGTFQAVAEIQDEGLPAASHFTCINATRETVRAQLATLKAMGVKRLVALRGDLPEGYHGGDFSYASDLVAFIRVETGDDFHISVACYPETHPQAHSPQADIDALLAKARAGADVAITQYFYNSDAYFRLLEDMDAIGLNLSVVPGILPITNAAQLLHFSDVCGAEIPRWIRQRLESLGDDQASIKAFGLDVMSRLCEELQAGGVPGIHFYSLNHSEAILGICDNLGWR